MDEIISDILRGWYDDELNELEDAIAIRRKRKLKRLSPGSRVRFNDKTRPAYLRGVEATVLTLNRETAWCKLDEPVGKFRGGKIKVPYSLLETV